MLVKSLVACLLSLPATVAVIGLCLALMSAASSWTLPSLLMVFPVWIGIASAAYLLPTAKDMAAVLCGVSGLGFGLIAVVKFLGWSGV